MFNKWLHTPLCIADIIVETSIDWTKFPVNATFILFLFSLLDGYDQSVMLDGHLTPEYIDDGGFYNGNVDYYGRPGYTFNQYLPCVYE